MMTETREQWIEREARKARERWSSSTQCDWRRVVAPFYPQLLRAPVDVDGLVKVMHDAYYHAGEGWWGAADAALAYLNIEPCDKPEYDPNDVVLTPNERNELENLRAECKRLRTQRREWTERDVEELAKALYEAPDAYRETWAWGKAVSWEVETRRNEARAALAWFDGKRGE